MQSSSTILISVVCGFFLIIAGMVAFAVFFIRKETSARAKIAQTLGFTPLADIQPLLQRIAFVNGINRPGLYRLEHVFHRHHSSGGDAYLFSLHRSYFNEQGVSRGKRPSGSHQTTLESSAIAFVSPAWQLPRFMAEPRLGGDHKLAQIGNSLSEAALGIKQEVIKFPHLPRLDEHYFIATLEPPASRENIPDNFWSLLADSPGLRLHLGGDTLTLSYDNSNTQTPDEEKMKKLYKIGIQLSQALPMTQSAIGG